VYALSRVHKSKFFSNRFKYIIIYFLMHVMNLRELSDKLTSRFFLGAPILGFFFLKETTDNKNSLGNYL
jgi:hypothetical protein